MMMVIIINTVSMIIKMVVLMTIIIYLSTFCDNFDSTLDVIWVERMPLDVCGDFSEISSGMLWTMFWGLVEDVELAKEKEGGKDYYLRN